MVMAAFLIDLALRPVRTWRQVSATRFGRHSSHAWDEDGLVAAAKYGDPEAFDELVEAYAPRLHAVARRMVGDDLAADVVQDAFFAAFKSLKRYRGSASFSTYLHTIVINGCKRALKKRPKHMSLLEHGQHDPQDGSDPSHQFERREARSQIDEAMGSLPDVFRETLSLREFSELSYSEIAEVLGIREGTVKSRIARARGLLRDKLEQMGVRP